jgi:hypothetical protein
MMPQIAFLVKGDAAPIEPSTSPKTEGTNVESVAPVGPGRDRGMDDLVAGYPGTPESLRALSER